MSELMQEKVYYKANPDFVTREIAGEVLLVPTGEAAQKLNGMVTFSETGGLLWKKLQDRCTLDELVEYLVDEYEEQPDAIRLDVEEFINGAVARNLVCKL